MTTKIGKIMKFSIFNLLILANNLTAMVPPPPNYLSIYWDIGAQLCFPSSRQEDPRRIQIPLPKSSRIKEFAPLADSSSNNLLQKDAEMQFGKDSTKDCL